MNYVRKDQMFTTVFVKKSYTNTPKLFTPNIQQKAY